MNNFPHLLLLLSLLFFPNENFGNSLSLEDELDKKLVDVSACNTTADLYSTRPEYPDLDPNGPFCPGETVAWCYELEFNSFINGSDDFVWIQGILPVLGCGWNTNLNDISGQGPSGWVWHGDGIVEYDVNSNFEGLDTNCCGESILVEGGSLSPGDPMPPGFWYTSAGGGGCTNDGDPDNHWGLPMPSGGSISVEFCFDLTVKNLISPDCFDPCDSDLLVQFFVYHDGETGCWDVEDCFGGDTATYDDEIACDAPLCLSIIDEDEDGYDITEDCNDNDPNINPGAIEICDGVDNNCDGDIDEGLLMTFYIDQDGDGYGDPNNEVFLCDINDEVVENNLDCDDTNENINPDAIEICDDFDNNCNGQINEGIIATYYVDNDGDGSGDPNQAVSDCMLNPGFSTDNLDCDDTNPNIYTNAPELCDGLDNDCNGMVDEGIQDFYYLDNDGDGFGQDLVFMLSCSPVPGYSLDFGDCDDNNVNVSPQLDEVCDGIDNDCDGMIDEDLGQNYFLDSDGDSFGDPNSSIVSCNPDPNYVLDDTDCNDANANVYPGAPELCDNLDNDCDGLIDEGVQIEFYQDSDNDGFGDPGITILACMIGPGLSVNNMDCDDTNVNVNPDAIEICDGIDNDCDGAIDEDLLLIFYADLDGDGFGDINQSTTACSVPVGFVEDNTDCDDSNPAIFPGAVEIANNGIDEDCDGNDLIDVFDEDQDGFTNDMDCNDQDATINPDAVEICDGIDNNCNGQIDEGLLMNFYLDEDGDSFGNSEISIQACSLPSGYVDNANDCDDTNPDINPAQSELCDGIDNDCNMLIDDLMTEIYYLDEDGDGYGTPDTWIMDCQAVMGYVLNDLDCDDTNSNINPSVPDIPNNGIDENCDGLDQTEGEDNDGDGYFGDNDCDDDNPDINPGAAELCDEIDNNCDGLIDEGLLLIEYYMDEDGDGYGTGDSFTNCDPDLGFATEDGDCDDTNPEINPSASEIPNNDIDEDCDGVANVIDEDGDGWNSDEDCNDLDANINPDAVEINGNGIDEDCDGVDGGSNVQEIDSFNVEFYPNPVSDQLQINTEHNNLNYKLYSLEGRLIIYGSVERTIDMKELQNGVYLLKLSSGESDQFLVQKLVKI